MTVQEIILWRGILLPGHEFCRLTSHDSGWSLEGSAVFKYEGQPCSLDYHILCDPTWSTHSATVEGWVGDARVAIKITTGPGRRWYLNSVEQPQVADCIDVDLNFSPSTNLIPIRRLSLEVDGQAEVTAAWLKFPGFTLEPLPQSYTRLAEDTYRYESGGGRFSADLKVNRAGFALDYPGIWQVEAFSGM